MRTQPILRVALYFTSLHVWSFLNSTTWSFCFFNTLSTMSNSQRHAALVTSSNKLQEAQQASLYFYVPLLSLVPHTPLLSWRPSNSISPIHSISCQLSLDYSYLAIILALSTTPPNISWRLKQTSAALGRLPLLLADHPARTAMKLDVSCTTKLTVAAMAAAFLVLTAQAAGSRFLADDRANPRAVSCRRNPSICSTIGEGFTCCNNKCVDLRVEDYHCGRCGLECNYTHKCCRGQCVNLAFDKRHCGRCNKKCKKGDFCIYGLCAYI